MTESAFSLSCPAGTDPNGTTLRTEEESPWHTYYPSVALTGTTTAHPYGRTWLNSRYSEIRLDTTSQTFYELLIENPIILRILTHKTLITHTLLNQHQNLPQ